MLAQAAKTTVGQALSLSRQRAAWITPTASGAQELPCKMYCAAMVDADGTEDELDCREECRPNRPALANLGRRTQLGENPAHYYEVGRRITGGRNAQGAVTWLVACPKVPSPGSSCAPRCRLALAEPRNRYQVALPR